VSKADPEQRKAFGNLQAAPVALLLGITVLAWVLLLRDPAVEQKPTVMLVAETAPVVTEPVAPAIEIIAPATEIIAPATDMIAPVADTVASVTEPDPASPLPSAKLVLILDDIGYNADAGLRAINLPAQITLAVIPHTQHGKTLAEAAHPAGRELMLHAPMSNLSGMELGEGGLTLQQSEEEFLQVLTAALADIPHIKGVNNHTGSELTAALQPMQWVMQELKNRDLYFVDSMTTRDSVAATTAAQFLVPSLRRHVFLDNVQTAEAIDVEFRRAIALAQQQGYAVAIGHPYPETLAYLEIALPLLAESQVEIVPVSVMLEQLKAADRGSAGSAATAAW
jgi:polysaccharide deacetylase 2 family uncharacterized protein YibQ